MEQRTSALVNKTIKRLLLSLKDVVHSTTSDNGKEFADHEDLEKTLDTQFYFARSYASYERGLNENTNGLIQQYFPKGRDFTTITTEEIIYAMKKLNNRPRKCLKFRSSNYVFFEVNNIAFSI